MKSNKIFLYMIIHDLKHPTESVITQLEHLKEELTEGRKQLKTQCLLLNRLDDKIKALTACQKKEQKKPPISKSRSLNDTLQEKFSGIDQILIEIDNRKRVTQQLIESNKPSDVSARDQDLQVSDW